MQVPATSGNNPILTLSGLKSFDFRPLFSLCHSILISKDKSLRVLRAVGDVNRAGRILRRFSGYFAKKWQLGIDCCIIIVTGQKRLNEAPHCRSGSTSRRSRCIHRGQIWKQRLFGTRPEPVGRVSAAFGRSAGYLLSDAGCGREKLCTTRSMSRSPMCAI